MQKKLSLIPILLTVFVLASSVAYGADDLKTHEVKAEDFKIEVELSGTFAAETTSEVKIEPKVWTQFKVLEAADHGAKVSEGEVLVRFDDEKLNERIESAELDQHLAELSIMQAEQELPRLERNYELLYEQAQKSHAYAEEDFTRWKEIDRPTYIKTSEFNLKSSKEYLENQQEELRQLEKMYAEDELTEETEEIILKRARSNVEYAVYSYKLSKMRHEERMEVTLPRFDQSMKVSLEQSEMSLARAKMAASISANEKRFALEKAKMLRQRALASHADLLADRKWLTVKSPAEGIVYYGRATDGKWSSAQSIKASLKPEGTVSPKTVFMTIVQIRPMKLISSVGEKDIKDVKEGAGAVIVPTADTDAKIEGRVKHVSSIPVSAGKFELDVDVSGELPDWLVPGMTGKVKVAKYERENALTVPNAAVRKDKEDEEKKYVLVKEKDKDEPQRRDVEVGKSHGGKTVILEGIEVGDQVVLGDPKKAAEKDDAEEKKESETKEEPSQKSENGGDEENDSADDNGSEEEDK